MFNNPIDKMLIKEYNVIHHAVRSGLFLIIIWRV